MSMINIRLLAVIFPCFLILSCSQDQETDTANSADENRNVQLSQTDTQLPQRLIPIKISFPKDADSRAAGDFDHAKFSIENYDGTIVSSGNLECLGGDNAVNCQGTTAYRYLKPAVYRINIMSESGLLGSDIFDLSPSAISIKMTIDNGSTGAFILSMLMNKTRFSREEIQTRLVHILSVADGQSIDLDMVIYDLVMYYGGSVDINKAIDVVVDKLRQDQPVNIEGQDGINGSKSPF